MSTEGQRPSVDVLLAALAERRRRRMLYYLRERGEATVDELAAVVTGWTAVAAGAGTTDRTDYERTRTSLYHVDVPALERAGVVEFDESENLVRYRPDQPLVEQLLVLTFEYERDRTAVPSPEGPPNQGG